MYLKFGVAVAIAGMSLAVSAQVKPAAPYKTKPSNEFKVNNARPSGTGTGMGAAQPAKASSSGKELDQIEKEHPAKTSKPNSKNQVASLEKPDKEKTPKPAINFKPSKPKKTPPPPRVADPYKGRLKDKGSQPQ